MYVVLYAYRYGYSTIHKAQVGALARVPILRG